MNNPAQEISSRLSVTLEDVEDITNRYFEEDEADKFNPVDIHPIFLFPDRI